MGLCAPIAPEYQGRATGFATLNSFLGPSGVWRSFRLQGPGAVPLGGGGLRAEMRDAREEDFAKVGPLLAGNADDLIEQPAPVADQTAADSSFAAPSTDAPQPVASVPPPSAFSTTPVADDKDDQSLWE